MAVNLIACITSFVIAFSVIPLIIKYSLRKNLLDIPGRRKIHKKVTPSLGGIGIFFGFVVGVFIWMDIAQWHELRFILASAFIMFFVGVRDDLVPFRALHKLAGQIIAVAVLIFSTIHIGSFYGFLGIHQIPLWADYLVTLFVVIVITNAFNLIDGLDGLAGSVGLCSFLAFGIWFYLADNFTFSLISFAMIGGILAFLTFNWEPSKIFMGDTGAMVIGMMLSVLTIKFMGLNYDLPVGHPAKFAGTISTAICFIIVPLCDTLRIIVLRLYKGHSPFTPDKSHIHHAIMRLGMSHSSVTIILSMVNLGYIGLAILFKNFSDNYLVLGIILLSTLLSVMLDQLILRKLSSKAQELK
ncbi:MAG: undecaprenyl/decaprenyl-phosphate alpha-N-acetylglucosaminyl 1-phosphate transferase [Bacteroidetes bacterium]|nr:undecaprenyl/decaprenyl-phosphate alpha-N-acetylglucosaminyl 1-phosphate transferase [Bacteroidota bacterium]